METSYFFDRKTKNLIILYKINYNTFAKFKGLKLSTPNNFCKDSNIS